MLFKYVSSFTLALLFSMNMHAGHHHDYHAKEVEININEGHCHEKERSLIGKIGAGSVQLVENNAYLLSFLGSLGYGYLAVKNPRFQDKHIPETAGKAFAVWIGLGWATRNVLQVVMSQCNIHKL